MVNFIPQFNTLRDELIEVVEEVLDSGNYVLGENVEKFEKEFAGYCGVKYGVGVNSGTDALILALKAVDVKDGDEVITVPNSFIATASTVINCGGKPVFADIELDTYNIDPLKIEKTIKDSKGHVHSILPVHLYGHPADMDLIVEIAQKNGLHIIEDACQAHGATYKNVKTGALGDIACFSFYPTKNLGAYGDGGMIVTDDYELAEKARLLRDYGRTAKYTHTTIGYNSRLDEIQAAVLRVKLKHLDKWIKMRRENAKIYTSLLQDTYDIITPVEKDYAKHVYWTYVIRSNYIDKLKDSLNNVGVGVGKIYPIPIHLQEAFKHLNLTEGSFPITEKCSKEILSLPMYPELTEAEIGYVTDTIKENMKRFAPKS